jgi:chromosome segregation ATPase
MGQMSKLAAQMEEYKMEQLEEMQNHYSRLETELHYLEHSKSSILAQIDKLNDQLIEITNDIDYLGEQSPEDLALELTFKRSE